MNKRQFADIINRYVPKPYEMTDSGEHCLQRYDYRYFRLLRFLEGKSPDVVVDVGCFPLTLIRLIRQQLPHALIYGLGLGIKDLEASLEDGRTRLIEVNLDPDVHFDRYDDTPVAFGLEDASADLVFFTEVIEHLYNPFPAMREIRRILKPGGLLYLTTDNVSNLGAIIRILRGRSPNGPLAESTAVDKPTNIWRGHVRLYSKDELVHICQSVDLQVVAATQFWNRCLSATPRVSLFERVVRNHVLTLVPSPWRGHHELVARKAAR